MHDPEHPEDQITVFDPNHLYANDEDALDIIAARATRNRWRSQGYGPEWIRLGDGAGSRIAYHGAKLNQWLAERMVSSTTEADQTPAAKRWAARRRRAISRRLKQYEAR